MRNVFNKLSSTRHNFLPRSYLHFFLFEFLSEEILKDLKYFFALLKKGKLLMNSQWVVLKTGYIFSRRGQCRTGEKTDKIVVVVFIRRWFLTHVQCSIITTWYLTSRQNFLTLSVLIEVPKDTQSYMCSKYCTDKTASFRYL